MQNAGMYVMKIVQLIVIILLLAGCGDEKLTCLGFEPIVNLATPSFGDVKGGDTITVKGVNFCPAPTVMFGENQALSVEYISKTEIIVVTAAGSKSGPVNLTITNSDGKSGMMQSGFTYTQQ